MSSLVEQTLLYIRDDDFLKFCIGMHCEENVYFIRNTTTYTTQWAYNGPLKNKNFAKRIYDTYLAPESRMQVNVSDDMAQKCLEDIQQQDCGKFVFDEVQKEVLILLSRGPFMRFKGMTALPTGMRRSSLLEFLPSAITQLAEPTKLDTPRNKKSLLGFFRSSMTEEKSDL